jgi:hypothetical protein
MNIEIGRAAKSVDIYGLPMAGLVFVFRNEFTPLLTLM